MGSFHSEDVDVLMAQDDGEYSTPELPFESLLRATSTENMSSDFLLDTKTWTFLNHGAFGASLRSGYLRAEEWRCHLERQPLRYFDRDLLPHLVYSARRLAKFTHASREGTTLLPNVTSGLNTIIRGYTRIHGRNSHVLLWDTSYGSLKKISRQLCERVTEIPVSSYFKKLDEYSDPSAIFDDALYHALKDISDTENALLILDHTTSNTAINMPLERLSKLGKEHGMLTMVDGAHGLLAQSVDLSALPDIDFYVANGHKWLACPRGIGMMHCSSDELRNTILEEPSVISHGIGQGYQSRFLWDGCRDYAAALSIPAVLDYWELYGINKVRADIQTKLEAAVELLTVQWHHGQKEKATLVPLELHSPMMALVRLPDKLQSADGKSSTSNDAKRIQDYLYDQFVEVPIKCINGVLYVRISCHIYNYLEEYVRLAQTLG